MRDSLRQLRMMHAVFVATWFLFLYALHVLKPVERSIDRETVFAFALVACADIAVALSLRTRRLTPALETLRTNPDDAAALARWRSGNIVSFTFAETVTLLGVALKFMGAGWNVAGIFFAVGLLLLVVWTPRLDVPSQ